MGPMTYLVTGVDWRISTLGETSLFVLLIVLAGIFPLRVGPKVLADVTTAVLFSAALILEPGAAAVAGVVGMTTYTLLNRWRGGELQLPWYKYPFNAGQTALFVGATSLIFHGLTSGDGVTTPAVVPAAAGLYLGNKALVSVAVSLQMRINPLLIWWRGTIENGPSELSQLALGFLGAMAYLENAWTIVALFVPVAMIYLAFFKLTRANAQVIQATDELAKKNEVLKGEIKERRLKETELLRSEKTLQALSRRWVGVQEEERRHLARELHDEIGQVLTGLKFSLEVNDRSSSNGGTNGASEAMALVDGLINRVREVSLELRPAMLDDLGLLATLLWYFDRYTAQTQVDVSFQHKGLEERFLPEVETATYRIVQEAFSGSVDERGPACCSAGGGCRYPAETRDP